MTQEASPARGPKLLDQVRDRIRVKHYSLRTEEAYVDWIKRYILHHGKRHPKELGAADVEAFLTIWRCMAGWLRARRIRPNRCCSSCIGRCLTWRCHGSTT